MSLLPTTQYGRLRAYLSLCDHAAGSKDATSYYIHVPRILRITRAVGSRLMLIERSSARAIRHAPMITTYLHHNKRESEKNDVTTK
jgi:hypothetical protein